MAMQSGEIRKLPAASSPMFVSQWAYQGTAKAPYIVSRKGGYKGTGYATEATEGAGMAVLVQVVDDYRATAKCKHIVAVMLEEKILVDVTPAEWKLNPVKKHPLIMVKPKGDTL